MQAKTSILKRLSGIALAGLLAVSATAVAQQPKPKPMGLPVKAAPVMIGTEIGRAHV